jgi:N-acetylglucosaminyldiphosphoundecaprenol N-acetyl-beta-D-mannosaminyltransferase
MVGKVDDKENVTFLGVRICPVSDKSLVNFVSQTVSGAGKARAVYVNVHAINLAQEQSWFRDFVNKSEVAYCDGYGVKWGARILGLRIPERLSPPDWIELLAAECNRKHYSLYLLGARPEVAMKVGVILRKQFPDLIIAGVHDGYFEKSSTGKANDAVIQAINNSHPDILLVGLGMPLQERWLMENWDNLDTKVALPVGAMFDYLAGVLPRAPHWMTDHGLEWLGRLISEPNRLWRRYLVGNPRFVWLVFKKRLGLIREKRKGIMV